MLFNVSFSTSHHYYIDFEANRHFNDYKETFFSLVKLNHFITVIDFNEKSIIFHQNTLKIQILIHDKSQIMIVRNILYVSDFSFNLLSIKTFERKSFRIVFDEQNYQIVRREISQLIAIEANLIAIDLYRLILVNDNLFDV